jgi:hypothetical protein
VVELAKRRRSMLKPIEVGWCECVNLPDFGALGVHAKIDTGAATSSVHAVRVKTFDKGGEKWASFTIPRSPDNPVYHCEAKIIGKRRVRSSNGQSQERIVIETEVCLGPRSWIGQFTLANRQSMAFPVLIGRRALRKGFLVNCARRWVQGKGQN